MDAATPPTDQPSPQHDMTTKHLRGSTLMLIGRLLAVAMNFGVQVLIVRHLSKSDYGAFAYALSLISLGASVAVFGLDKSVGRFVPIYQEQRDYNKVFGTIALMVGTILALGLLLVAAVFGLRGWIADTFISDASAVSLLMILAILTPVTALDSLILSLFAVFARPRASFFPKHLLGPGLQLVVVLGLVLGRSDVVFLAQGYLAAGLLGTAIDALILLRILGNTGVLQHLNVRRLDLPAREVFSFTVPLLISDLVFVLRSSVVILLLGHFHTTADVAAFRAVLPVARLNLLVYQSFTFLFTPLATRLFVQEDRKGINSLYWQTAIWIAVISFPIFAVSFCLARPLTVLLFGARYQDSAILLALLALGFYFNAALGFNGLALRVYGKVRYIFVVDSIVAALSLAASLLLIPRYGALGAALATSGTMILQNLLYQAGLPGIHIRLFERRYLNVYLLITLGALGLLLFQVGMAPAVFVSFALAAVVCFVVIALNRKPLNVGQTFPELMRFSLARRFFGT